MDIFAEAGLDRLRVKSQLLTGYLEFLLNPRESEMFSVITPRDPQQRGAQLSLQLKEQGKTVLDKLATRGVICDFREPDVIRVAPVPLYNTFSDVYRFAEVFSAALKG